MRTTNTLSDIRQWFDTPLGQQVVATQRAVLDQLLPGIFGYHLLQMSIQGETLFESSPIQHKFAMGLETRDPGPLIGEATNLPLPDDSMDVVMVHHLLEFFDSPQQMLREVSRVALPMGHVVLMGFNPLSLWGVYKPIGKLRGDPPWIGDFIRPGRLMDWLTLLNFKIDRVHYCAYRPPINRPGFVGEVPDYSEGLSRYSSLPFGALFFIVARKQVGTLTPIRPVWRPSPSFGRLTVVRPASRAVTRTPPEALD